MGHFPKHANIHHVSKIDVYLAMIFFSKIPAYAGIKISDLVVVICPFFEIHTRICGYGSIKILIKRHKRGMDIIAPTE